MYLEINCQYDVIISASYSPSYRHDVTISPSYRHEHDDHISTVTQLLLVVPMNVSYTETCSCCISSVHARGRVCLTRQCSERERETLVSSGVSVSAHLKTFPWLNFFPSNFPSHARYSSTLVLVSALPASSFFQLYDS